MGKQSGIFFVLTKFNQPENSVQFADFSDSVLLKLILALTQIQYNDVNKNQRIKPNLQNSSYVPFVQTAQYLYVNFVNRNERRK